MKHIPVLKNEILDAFSYLSKKSDIVFVDGNLTINSDWQPTGFTLIAASGKITITSDVNYLNAIILAKDVEASDNDGETGVDKPLTIKGMVFGVSSVKFLRSLYPKSLNNDGPSVIVEYNPELLFMTVPGVEINNIKISGPWRVN